MLAVLIIAGDFYLSPNPYQFTLPLEVMVFSGLFANSIYYRKFKKIRTESKRSRQPEEAQLSRLQALGGTDWRQPVVLLASLAAVTLLLPSAFGIHLFRTQVRGFTVQSLAWYLVNPDPQANVQLLRQDYASARLQGDFQRSLSVNENTLKLAAFQLGEDHPLTIGIQSDLIENKLNQGAYAEARQLTEAVIKQYQLQFGPDHMFTAFMMNHLVANNLDRGVLAEAKSTCFNCLLILEKYPKNLTHPVILANLASIYSNMGVIQQWYCQYDEAEKNQREALELELQASKGYTVDVCLILERQGDLYKEEMKLDEATDAYARAKGIIEKTLGLGNPLASSILLKLGEVRVLNNQVDAALPLVQESHAMNEHYYGKFHVATAESAYQLSRIFFLLGKLHESEEYLAECLQATQQAIGKHNLIYAKYLMQQAEIDMFKNRFAGAEQELREALALYQETFGENHPRLLEPLEQLDALYEKTGNSVLRNGIAEHLQRIKSNSPKQIPLDTHRISI